jgi:hemerythrin-like domain-containing protein
MMNLERQTTRRLHEEHVAAVDLLGRFEQTLANYRDPPNIADDQWRGIARDMGSGMAGEIERHFDFEEQALFPRLEANGEGTIVQLLSDEHSVIRQVATELGGLLQASLTEQFEGAEWRTLKMLGFEYVERMISHVQKEEMALLPALENILGEDDDAELVLDYAG